MDITLTNFQLKAIADLTEAMDKPNREIVLKSCTGSGKTIILTHFMDSISKVMRKLYLFGLLRVKVIWKNKAKVRWTSIFTVVTQNYFVIL